MAKSDALAAFEKALRSELEELRALSETGAASRAPVTLDQQSVGRLSRMEIGRAHV